MMDSFSAPVFCLTTGLNKFYHTRPQKGIPCIKCALEELCKTNSQNSQSTQVLRYFKCISPTKQGPELQCLLRV